MSFGRRPKPKLRGTLVFEQSQGTFSEPVRYSQSARGCGQHDGMFVVVLGSVVWDCSRWPKVEECSTLPGVLVSCRVDCILASLFE